jgi:hypothetical protein
VQALDVQDGRAGRQRERFRLGQERLAHGEFLHDLVNLDPDGGHPLNDAAARERALLGQRDRRALGEAGRLVAGGQLHRLAVRGQQVLGGGDQRGGGARAEGYPAEAPGDRGWGRDVLGLVFPAHPVASELGRAGLPAGHAATRRAGLIQPERRARKLQPVVLEVAADGYWPDVRA